MTPNKEQMYLLIVALDLAGVGPTKGVKPDFASMLHLALEGEITGPMHEALHFGTNGPAGKHPAYPEKATTWKTLLKHGKKLLADYSTPINADLYKRIGAEYNMMQNTRKNCSSNIVPMKKFSISYSRCFSLIVAETFIKCRCVIFKLKI